MWHAAEGRAEELWPARLATRRSADLHFGTHSLITETDRQTDRQTDGRRQTWAEAEMEEGEEKERERGRQGG